MRKKIILAMCAFLGNGVVLNNVCAMDSPAPANVHPAPEIPDIIHGDPNAPVALIEYLSLNCGHCALFHQKYLPQLQKKYVEDKKLKIVYRHFPLDYQAAQAMIIIASLPKDQWYNAFSKALEKQSQWFPKGGLEKLAELCNIDKVACQKALNNKTLEDAVVAKRFNAEAKYDIPATPKFIIQYAGGEDVLPTAISFEDIEKKLDHYIQKSQGPK